MNEHLAFEASPEQNLKDLSDLLNRLAKFSIIHESFINDVAHLMSKAYPKARKAYICSVNDIKKNANEAEYDDYYVYFADNLWDFIKENEKVQFIIDFRNAISVLLKLSDFSVMDDPSVLTKLIQMR